MDGPKENSFPGALGSTVGAERGVSGKAAMVIGLQGRGDERRN